MDTLNVLRNRLPVPTNYTQLLKSRIGRTLSLFNFCRYISDRLFYYNTKLTPYIPTPEREGFTALFGKAILVVDDVATSGATFNACAKALVDVGVSRVYDFSLARAAYSPNGEIDIT